MSWVSIDIQEEKREREERTKNAFSQCLTLVSTSPNINGIWTKDFEQHDTRAYYHELHKMWALDIRFPSSKFRDEYGVRRFIFDSLMNQVPPCTIRLAKTLDQGLLNLHPLGASFWNDRKDIQEWIVQECRGISRVQAEREYTTIQIPKLAPQLFKYKYTTTSVNENDIVYIRSQGLFFEGQVVGRLPFVSFSCITPFEIEPNGDYVAILSSDVEPLVPSLPSPIDLSLDFDDAFGTMNATILDNGDKVQSVKRKSEPEPPQECVKKRKMKDSHRVSQLIPVELPPNNLSTSTSTTLGKLLNLMQSSPDLPEDWDWIQYLEEAGLDIVLLGPQNRTLALSLSNGALETKGMNLKLTADTKDKEGNIVKHNTYYSTESRIISDTSGVRLRNRKCQKTASTHGVSFSAGRYKREATGWAAWFIAWVEAVKVLMDLPVPRVTKENDYVIAGKGVQGCSSIYRNTQKTVVRFIRDVTDYDGIDHSPASALEESNKPKRRKKQARQSGRKNIAESRIEQAEV